MKNFQKRCYPDEALKRQHGNKTYYSISDHAKKRFAERFGIVRKGVIYKILNTGTVIVETEHICHIRNDEIYVICSKLPSQFNKWKVVTVYKRPMCQYQAKLYPNTRFGQG